MTTATANEFSGLVNSLANELAQARRDLAAVTRKASTSARSLEGRTQDLTEARAALALLLATLDSTTDGVLAMGYFGRAMHYNSRFIEIWRIPPDTLPTLNDASLVAMQLAQVRDPKKFAQDAQARKEQPDTPHFSLVELADGRILECHVLPQRVRGKRLGSVTSYHDVTERERMGRMLSVLEAEVPDAVARARAATQA